ncbi:MAG: 50S ribosomal protein L23 [Candidatus Portnoybacteria bacterium]|nr:50S ribosomal protein L23 [Candidatus Portnoybacteria bacterium]MDD4982583.1 50S ribosomal protein L23 [Candidatus Portnoybacteria bacterium]
MAIFGKTKKELVKKAVAKKMAPVKVAKKAEPKKNFKGTVVKKEFSEAYRILHRPMVTEKSFDLSGKLNQYIFEVAPGATKNETKKVIQDLYGVKVIRVNTINVPGKKRRVGGHEGFRSGFKKAIVFLAEGEKIEVISR